MHHHELDSAVEIGRLVTGVEPGTAGTAGQQDQRHDEGKIFHGEGQYAGVDNATV
ncbi:hypothetical protein D3C85_1111950 [compost metagenome]